MHYRHIVFDLENTLADPGMTETGHTGNLSGRFSACTGIRPLLQGLNAMHFTVGAITCRRKQKERHCSRKPVWPPVSPDSSTRKIPTEKPSVRLNAIWKNREYNAVTSCSSLRRKQDARMARKTGIDCVLAEWCHRETATTDASVTRLKRRMIWPFFWENPAKTFPIPGFPGRSNCNSSPRPGKPIPAIRLIWNAFGRIREIAAEIMTAKSGLEMETVKNLFCNESGFQTPKLDTRAAIFENGKILLVRETAGKWSLPGGWVDVDQSIASNTVKEVKEEAGLDVEPSG